MSFDTLIMQAVTAELQEELPGAVVQKVTEPVRGEIILNLYHQGRQLNLLFSIDSKYARVHLSGKASKKEKNNPQPSPFCMLLRKYLIGCRILNLGNPPLERILEIAFAPQAGLTPVSLIAEIMSRRSNLILIGENRLILGAARIAGWEKNPLRAIYPGEKYRPVPTQNKLNPLQMSAEDFTSAFLENLAVKEKPEQALLMTVDGISPLIAKELNYRSGQQTVKAKGEIDTYTLFSEIRSLFNAMNNRQFNPVLLPGRNIYAAIRLTHLSAEEQIEQASINEMLDCFYSGVIRTEAEKTLKNLLHNAVERRLTALKRKELALKKDLKTTELAPQHRHYGELLLAYGDQVPRGADAALLPDLYKPDEKVIVPLNPSRTAAANAQHYFNCYRKAKKGRDEVRRQLKITYAETEYCRSLLYSIESAVGSSLSEIRLELIDAGYLRDKLKGKKKETALPQPLIFKSESGKTILVGRNNRQNDHVTFKTAVRRDIWFHIRQLPGSHVILKETGWPPAEVDLEEAAFLAAYFSKGRESSAADVDYTEVRHVRRRPGGKPGQVFYENYETVTVNPLDQILKKQFNLQ
jgi:predicted ribosome quality control (RQC) complex YloA/Tae2 family protein